MTGRGGSATQPGWGQTPCLHHPGARQKASLISAITWQPGADEGPRLYLQVHPRKAIRAPDVIGFLTHLMRHIEGPLMIVWDRGGPHPVLT